MKLDAKELASELTDAVEQTDGLDCDISKHGEEYIIVIYQGYDLVFEKRVKLEGLYEELNYLRVLVQSGIWGG